MRQLHLDRYEVVEETPGTQLSRRVRTLSRRRCRCYPVLRPRDNPPRPRQRRQAARPAPAWRRRFRWCRCRPAPGRPAPGRDRAVRRARQREVATAGHLRDLGPSRERHRDRRRTCHRGRAVAELAEWVLADGEHPTRVRHDRGVAGCRSQAHDRARSDTDHRLRRLEGARRVDDPQGRRRCLAHHDAEHLARARSGRCHAGGARASTSPHADDTVGCRRCRRRRDAGAGPRVERERNARGSVRGRKTAPIHELGDDEGTVASGASARVANHDAHANRCIRTWRHRLGRADPVSTDHHRGAHSSSTRFGSITPPTSMTCSPAASSAGTVHARLAPIAPASRAETPWQD